MGLSPGEQQALSSFLALVGWIASRNSTILVLEKIQAISVQVNKRY